MGERKSAELLFKAGEGLPEAGGDLRMAVLVSEVGGELSVFVGKEAGGSGGEE